MVGYRLDLKNAIDQEIEADKITRGVQVNGKKHNEGISAVYGFEGCC